MPEYDIKQVQSIEKFLKYWTQAMIDTHWFKEHILFHYTRNEMIEEITKEFAELDNLYLVATSKDAKKIFGVLRVKVKENIGKFLEQKRKYNLPLGGMRVLLHDDFEK